MQVEDKVLLEIQASADPFGEAVDIALAQRHAAILRQAIIDLPTYPQLQFRVKVVVLPGISDAVLQDNAWVAASGRGVSPWLSISSDGPEIIELVLYVSALRVIYDQYVMDNPAAWKTYIEKISFDPVSTSCMSDLANMYSEAVSSGRGIPENLFQETCLDGLLAPHLLALFQSAPQNFFGPFEYVVFEHMKHVEIESEEFYRVLYPTLLEHGLAELRSSAPPNADWWRPALRHALR